MPKRILIIGGVALGPKVACRARRLDPEAEITMIDRDAIISYGGCGIPYFVSGDVADVKELRSTTYHVQRDAPFFEQYKRVQVRTRTEALAIDRKARTVRVKSLDTGAEEELAYDALVLATGSTPFVPPVPGADLPRVYAISDLGKAMAIKDELTAGKVGSAVIVGAGAIGLEMAEALTELWGIDVTLVEMQENVLPQAMGSDLGMIVRRALETGGVKVLTGEKLLRIVGDPETGVTGVECAGAGHIDCDMVIFGAGSRPNTRLAREAGLVTGASGGVLVDARMRTNDPYIYAGGDCVEVRHLISGQHVHLPLGSLANRMGRIIGTNVTGGAALFEGAVGTFIIKVFDLGVAKAGLTLAQAKAAGFDAEYAIMAMADRAHFYPTQKMMYLKLIADRKSRRVLGIECVGENGDAVKARVDAVAALMQRGRCTVEDVSVLEVGYAPPFASAMDIVNAAGNALENILDGRSRSIGVEEFLEKFKAGKLQVLDVRVARGATACVEKYGSCWTSIPQECLEGQLGEVPEDTPDKDVVLFCNSGLRSYESQCYLASKGKDLPHVQGGWVLLKCHEPDFAAGGPGAGDAEGADGGD